LEDKDLINLNDYHVTGVRGVKKPKKIMVFKLEKQCVHSVETIEVQARVQKYVKVAVFNKVIQKGITIQKGDWEWQEKNADSLMNDAITDEKDLNGKRGKKAFSKGEVITAHALEKSPDIQSGQKVVILVYGRGVTLSLEGVSQEEGNIQDWISLKPENSNQVIKAQVVETNVAQIVLSRRR
jgi:flagella basal body P-ring formation protein FlgA